MIFITGATGSIGRELCRLLAADNVPARVLCRKEEQLPQFLEMGLEAVMGDFNTPSGLRMEGCDRLFLLTPPSALQTQQDKMIVDKAIEAGVKHIVRISTADANLSSRLSWAKWHAEADHYLRSKSVNWTIIRPTGFMQNFIESPVSKGILPHLIGEGQISYIDLRDIALVAKHLLTEDKHGGAVYYLTGPESLTVKNAAALFSTVLGYEVRDVNTTVAEMVKALKAAHLSDWYIDALIEQFASGAGGYEIDVTEEVKRLTGFAPRTFAQFAQDYKNQLI